MARQPGTDLSLSLFLGLALVPSILLITVAFVKLGRFRRLLPTLREWTGADPPVWPRLSVIVPCRNEEVSVERAMRSLLAQDYPNLEIVAIDDRSEDRTGGQLDALALTDPRLTVVHIKELPEGWLGKNNAMHQGAARASGEWLLFTDGDVIFEAEALKRSVAFALAHGLGHFVALPHFIAPGFLERAFVANFLASGGTLVDPASLHVPRTFAFVGVGAFGLVRHDAYRSIGGHERIAYEVGDDVKLGLLLRRHGWAQGCLDSDGLVRVRWQNGFLATLRGLEKNSFVIFEWNGWIAALALPLVFLENLAPYPALLLPVALPVKAMAATVVALRAAAVGAAARRGAEGSGLEGLASPLTSFLFPCVVAWSTLLTLGRGGVRWRGTFYPLAKLRARCLPMLSLGTEKVIGWTPPPRPRR